MRYLLAVLLGLSLLSCASFQFYTWKKVIDPTEYRFWTVADLITVRNLCKDDTGVACTQVRGNICDTYSIYTKEEAKLKFDPDGLTIFEHEDKHCDGWVHE